MFFLLWDELFLEPKSHFPKINRLLSFVLERSLAHLPRDGRMVANALRSVSSRCSSHANRAAAAFELLPPTCSGRNDWHFMGELTAQVRISEFSNCKTWYENERVCGIEHDMKSARRDKWQNHY